MKKITCLISVLLVMLGLTACGSGPESVVGSFCDGMRKFDYQKMNECLYYPSDSVDDPFDGDEEMEVFYTYVKEQARSMKYKVVGSEKNGDSAAVDVEFTYADISPVIKSVFADYFSRAMSLAFSGGSEEEAEQLLYDILEEKVKEEKPGKATETVRFYCRKKDGKWKIEEPSEELVNVLTCNLVKGMQSVCESLY